MIRLRGRLGRLLVLLLTIGLVAAACGSDDGDDDASASASAADTEASASEPAEEEGDEEAIEKEPAEEAGPYPVTLTQQMGEVTIPAEPETIVAVDLWSVDFLSELGIVPAQAYTFGPPPGFVDTQGVEVTPVQGDLPIETIAAAGPDLITDISGFFTTLDAEVGETLTGVAPTLSPPGDALEDGWQDRFRHLAAALDRADDAEAIIAEAEAKAASIATEFPELDGAAITFARYNGAELSTIDLVIDDSDFTRRFMNDELGFTTPPAQQEAFDAGEGEPVGGALGVSLERVDLVGEGADAVVMFLAADGDDFIENPIWQAQDIVAEDRVVYVDLDGVFAVRTPSPAAIDYLFENVLPPLAAAARGDGASSVAVEGGDDVVAVGAEGGSTQIGVYSSFSPAFAQAVGGPGPVTAFLPSDEALVGLDPSVLGALQADFDLLDRVLQYHAVAEALTAENLIAAGEVDTLLGEAITIAVDGDTVVLNDGQATVSTADIEASNGITHVIEGLLIPPSLIDQLGG